VPLLLLLLLLLLLWVWLLVLAHDGEGTLGSLWGWLQQPSAVDNRARHEGRVCRMWDTHEARARACTSSTRQQQEQQQQEIWKNGSGPAPRHWPPLACC
jgi:hypothetical protein